MSNDWIRASNELGRIWKEVTVVQVSLASVAGHSPELTEKNHETPRDNVSRSRSEMGISRVQVISVTFLWSKGQTYKMCKTYRNNII